VICSGLIDYNKKLISVKGGGKTPIILNVENEWEEANFIADRILDNYINNNKLYSDHLILSRSQFYTTKIQAIFLEKKIPYITYGGRKFMESAHIKDLISALRVVNNFNDEIAWIRFLTLWEGIGEIRASKYIENLLELKSISDCIVHLSKIHKNDSNSIIPKILSKALENKGDLQKLVDVTYELMEKRLSEKYKEDWVRKRKTDFPVLSVLAGKYSSLGEFISECILDNSTNINNSPTLMGSSLKKTEIKDVAIISTIHSAKGLESDICFIVNVSPKNFPSSLSINDIDQIEEERRVLYVALTRAKNELIITRNLSSINSERKILEPLEESYQIKNSDQEQRDKKILKTYFLNALPEKLVKQEIVKFSKESVGDIEKPNELIIDYGIDFS
jgi:DNA helicase-2/ATP-dependent DNA helicase PcrA